MWRSLLFVRLFWRDVKTQKKRMGLTLLAVLWGTLSIVLLLAFGEGLETELKQSSKGLGGPIFIIWGGQTTIPYEGLGKGRRISFLPEHLDIVRQKIPGIKEIGAEYNNWGTTLTYGNNTVSARTNGVFPCYETMRAHYPQAGGRFINRVDMTQRRRVLFLGNELKEELCGDEDPVGKTVMIDNIPFTVIGILQEKMQMGSYSGPDYGKATIPATTHAAIWGDTYYQNLVIEPANPEESEYVKRRLYEVFSDIHKFDPSDRAALSFWDTIEGQREMDKVFLGVKIFFVVMGFFSLSIAGVGVANIMYAAIKKRTTEIGVKMALGAKRRQIMGQFILEALLICGVGGFLGILIGQALCSAYGTAEFDVEWVTMLGKPTISLSVGLITVAILAFIGLTSGFFPARRAASVNPVESLRYE
jgi:putative ABC transport system permease protein